tara:strand:+ start:4858 stop:5241 length:384 start_codon:yes stop_codon:yes gene_type:complete
MKVSIIKEDGTIVKDGVGYGGIDLSALPSNFHAVQWDGSSGELETMDGNGNTANTAITDLSPYQWCIDLWDALDVAVQADNVPAPEWLAARSQAYGSAQYQLEYITENGLEAWQTRVAEIKAAHPKT